MAFRRRRQHQHTKPRGILLAFFAVAIQAMLPFFVAVAIARASNPAFAENVPICSSLGPAAHHDSGTTGDDQQSGGGCPICAAVAVGQSFTATAAPQLPLPVSCDRVVLSATDTPSLACDVSSSYQSRAPPSIA